MSLLGMELRDHLADIMQNKDWLSIDQLLGEVDQVFDWDESFLANAVQTAKKEEIRRQIKQIKDDDSVPFVASIERTGDDGKPERVYKQESLFGVEDYQQVYAYYKGRSKYFGDMAKQYRKRCRDRFGIDPAAGP